MDERRNPFGHRFVLTLVAVVLALSSGQLRASGSIQDEAEEDELAVIEALDLRAGGHERKQYFLIGREGAEAPKDGFRLLLVLPGGSGDADFHPFVKRIHEHVLDEKYLIAQLVAPAWTQDQKQRLVWPIKKNPWQKMQFTTEEFVNAVIADVEERRPVDPSYIFTLAWSSGGPAAYAYSVCSESRATGTFVAMSIFDPGGMESFKNAKGQAYFLLHSPEDFISMDHPKLAEKKLKKSKATVELVTYSGGHGWAEDPYGHMRQGIAFLEQNHGKAKKAPKKKKKK